MYTPHSSAADNLPMRNKTVDTPTLLARAVCANEEVSARGVMRALTRRHACALTLFFLSVGFYSSPSLPRCWVSNFTLFLLFHLSFPLSRPFLRENAQWGRV
uniref:Transmembrane protein n=1 Tax=Hymenolepis diminuta TaxID=6216 RepID=A0A0R3S814_HYMDI